MAIQACSVCASRKLRMPGFSDGVVPETDNLGEFVCDNGHKMVPVEFDRDADYKTFKAAL